MQKFKEREAEVKW